MNFWQRHLQISYRRLLIRGGAILVLVSALAILRTLPILLRIDFYHTTIHRRMQEALGRRVSLGPIYGQIFPQPGIVATDVVLYDPANRQIPQFQIPRLVLVFFPENWHHWTLQLKQVSMQKPRFFLRRSGPDWAFLRQPFIFPPPAPGGQTVSNTVAPSTLQSFSIANGEINWTDETFHPPVKYKIDSIFMDINLASGTGNAKARVPVWGPKAMLSGRYVRKSQAPINLQIENADPAFLKFYFPDRAAWLKGSLTANALIHLQEGSTPPWVSVRIKRWTTERLPGVEFSGWLGLHQQALRGELRTDSVAPPMRLRAEVPLETGRIDLKAHLSGLSPVVLKMFGVIHWMSRVQGPGPLDFSFQKSTAAPQAVWTLQGGNLGFAGTSDHIDQLTASQDAHGLQIKVVGSPGKGHATVLWSRRTGAAFAQLNVNASSVTVRNVLEVFDLQAAISTTTPVENQRFMLRPLAYEGVHIDHALMEARVYTNRRFDIQRATGRIEGSPIDLTGSVNLARKPMWAEFQGQLHRLVVARLAEQFFIRPPEITGYGRASFDLQFPLSKSWAPQMTGTASAGLVLPWRMHLTWTRDPLRPYQQWQVNVTSTTVRSILEVTGLRPTAPVANATEMGAFIPSGYETLGIGSAAVELHLFPGQRIDIVQAAGSIENGLFESTGTVTLASTPPAMALGGTLRQLPLERVLPHFFVGPPAISGTGKAGYALRFPLSRDWLKNFDGTVDAEAANGVVAALKTFYAIMSVTNLTNYLTLRLPDTTVSGIPFTGLAGAFAFQNGVLSTDDLFLRSPDVNMSASGAIDFPASHIKAVVKIQVFRFVEEVVSHIPGVSLIFKNGHRILLPVPVHLEGPLNRITVS